MIESGWHGFFMPGGMAYLLQRLAFMCSVHWQTCYQAHFHGHLIEYGGDCSVEAFEPCIGRFIKSLLYITYWYFVTCCIDLNKLFSLLKTLIWLSPRWVRGSSFIWPTCFAFGKWWQMEGVVSFFGRVAMLIDQNTQAFHMFMSALLQVVFLFVSCQWNLFCRDLNVTDD